MYDADVPPFSLQVLDTSTTALVLAHVINTVAGRLKSCSPR